MTTDLGILTCLDAATGKELWRQRLSGNYSASPTLADGKIYLLNEEGSTVVIANSAKYELLATNQLEGRTLASPAPIDGAIYLRTDTHLYRLEEPKSVRASATLPIPNPVTASRPIARPAEALPKSSANGFRR
jgi:outer membrane protein assembly factor BamB